MHDKIQLYICISTCYDYGDFLEEDVKNVVARYGPLIGKKRIVQNVMRENSSLTII
jgi:hypothetical protein